MTYRRETQLAPGIAINFLLDGLSITSNQPPRLPTP